MVKAFKNNEQVYLGWCNQHPEGFVLNTRKKHDLGYMVLHKATCRTIKSHRDMDRFSGGFTERNYIKVCADNINDLRKWVKVNGRSDGSFSKICKLCFKE